MAKFNSLLNLRLKSKDSKKDKTTALAERSSTGNLSSFSGVFRVSPLSDREKESLKNILSDFKGDSIEDISDDYHSLVTLTSEVRAIRNQAAMLHGERIKKAQVILKGYKEGAFTAWLIATYGNRQTPYNYLQYFDLYSSMPQPLKEKIEEMPRQAVYTLASRSGEKEKKEEFVKKYKGEAKEELISVIRKIFPLAQTDKRVPNLAKQTQGFLKRVKLLMQNPLFLPNGKQKKHLIGALEELLSFLKK